VCRSPDHPVEQVLDGGFPGDRIEFGFGGHDPPDGEPLEGGLHDDLLRLAGRGDEDEEGDHDPEEVEREDTGDTEKEGEPLADGGSDARGLEARPVPGEQRAQHPAAVHREPW